MWIFRGVKCKKCHSSVPIVNWPQMASDNQLATKNDKHVSSFLVVPWTKPWKNTNKLYIVCMYVCIYTLSLICIYTQVHFSSPSFGFCPFLHGPSRGFCGLSTLLSTEAAATTTAPVRSWVRQIGSFPEVIRGEKSPTKMFWNHHPSVQQVARWRHFKF